MDQIKLLFFCKKYFFTSFYLHLISKLGPDSNTEKNSKHWRQYMQNFQRTPLIREFYRNADSNDSSCQKLKFVFTNLHRVDDTSNQYIFWWLSMLIFSLVIYDFG